ncbi:MAG: DUF3618 domain-containing protein [Gemmatimonadaceae bacterium]
MAETTADVRRDIELTRERMSSTLDQLEQRLNLSQVVRDNPWPALGAALAAGIILSGSRADVKATAATLAATRGAQDKLGPALDDIVTNLVNGVSAAFQQKIERWVDEVKAAIGAPTGSGAGTGQRQPYADMSSRAGTTGNSTTQQQDLSGPTPTGITGPSSVHANTPRAD